MNTKRQHQEIYQEPYQGDRCRLWWVKTTDGEFGPFHSQADAIAWTLIEKKETRG